VTNPDLGGTEGTAYAVEIASLKSPVTHLVECTDGRVLKSEVSYLLQYLLN
jgi:hypothetical protein